MNAYWKKKGSMNLRGVNRLLKLPLKVLLLVTLISARSVGTSERKPLEKVSFILMYFHTSYGKCRTLSTTAKLVSSLQMLTPCTLGMRLLHSIPVLWKGQLRVVLMKLEELDLVSQEAMVQESFSSLLPRRGV